MANYEALISFCGVESMTVGEVKELTDKAVIDDLLNAGYIKEQKVDKKKAVYHKEK